MNATNVFSAVGPDGKRRDDGLRRHQFGGTLGGPIMRDKLFYFVGYQGTKVHVTPTSAFANVPTARMLAGDFTQIASPQCNNGRTITPSTFGGKLLVLNFWATWCEPCIEEIPSLNAFQRRFEKQGVVVLGVSVDKDEKMYRDFLSRARVSFLTARDPDAKINADYGTMKFPETYIIDGRGKVLRKIISNQDWMSERVIRDMESLL